jgi:hypothetical protein
MVGETSDLFAHTRQAGVGGLFAHTRQAGVGGCYPHAASRCVRLIEHNKASNVTRENIGSDMKKN